jgi:hypothetical protein
MTTGEMTMVVEVIPAPRFAAGDLRILAMSEGMERRDFSIGQKGGQVYARVRTPLFGASARGVNANVASDSVPLTITTTFDAHRFSIRTDQASAEELCLSMLGGVWVVGEGFTLTLVLLVMSMALGFASIVSQTRPARGVAATAGVALAATGLWMTGVFSHQATSSWNIALPLLVCWFVALRQVTRARGELSS